MQDDTARLASLLDQIEQAMPAVGDGWQDPTDTSLSARLERAIYRFLSLDKNPNVTVLPKDAPAPIRLETAISRAIKVARTLHLPQNAAELNKAISAWTWRTSTVLLCAVGFWLWLQTRKVGKNG